MSNLEGVNTSKQEQTKRLDRLRHSLDVRPGAEGDAPDRPLTSAILFVCTANLCRSPMAQGLAARLVEDRQTVLDIGSAGVAATDGSPLHPLAADALGRRDAALPGFTSRLLRAEHLRGADLVLTATRAHRAHCARLMPSAARRCFTLAQLSRLARVMETEDLADRVRAQAGNLGGQEGTQAGTQASTQGSAAPAASGVAALLAAVPLARARLQPVSPEEDDLADPVLAGQAAFEQCADTIESLLAAPLRLICS